MINPGFLSKGMLQKTICNIPFLYRYIVFPNRLCNKECQVIGNLGGLEGPQPLQV